MGDVIDFERLVQRDDVAPVAADEVVDIDVDTDTDADATRATVFLRWLDRRRAAAGPAPSGTTYERSLRVVRWLVVLTGLVVGGGLAGSLLSHRDAEPINALMFLGATVGLQALVVVVVAIAWMLRGLDVRFRPVDDVVSFLVAAVARLLDRLDGTRRSAVRARWATLDLRSERLAPLVGLQMLGITQRFAIAFNIGLVAAMLLVWLPFVELRFGWQSTYTIDAATVDTWVRGIATPWRWISTELAPDATQVAATRYTRGQPADSLPIAAARAWWPFLVCAILCYGLMLRVVIAVVVAATLRRRLDRLTFAHPAANALWRRLQGPLVAAQPNDARLPAATGSRASTRRTGLSLLVVDEDLEAEADRVAARVASLFGSPATTRIAASVDDDRLDAALRPELAGRGEGVAIAIAASRDPLVAVADFLRAVVVAAGPTADVTVVLIAGGREDVDERAAIWRRFVAIHRLAVNVETCT